MNPEAGWRSERELRVGLSQRVVRSIKTCMDFRRDLANS